MKRPQCKDIPTKPILEFLHSLNGRCANWYERKHENSVRNAMPEWVDATPKLILAKMVMLHRAGLVDGCVCGCRGDFELTEKGAARIGKEFNGKPDSSKITSIIPEQLRAPFLFLPPGFFVSNLGEVRQPPNN